MRIRVASVVVCIALAVACARPSPAPRSEAGKDLIVGTSAGSPPYATRREGTITGLEVDLATEVGKALGRPVRFVDLPWDQLFDALANRRVDVVMAGVTITDEREQRFAFADPYLRTGLVALVRHADRKRFVDGDAVCKGPAKVGVLSKTTGERYVHDRCRSVRPRAYQTADDAVNDARARRIDAVVHDAPVLAYLAQQGVQLDMLPMGSTDQRLAWMVRRDDAALRDALNSALTRLRNDGALDRAIEHWMPQILRIRWR